MWKRHTISVVCVFIGGMCGWLLGYSYGMAWKERDIYILEMDLAEERGKAKSLERSNAILVEGHEEIETDLDETIQMLQEKLNAQSQTIERRRQDPKMDSRSGRVANFNTDR